MSSLPHYAKPPIVEAILDIQVELPGSIHADVLAKCQKPLKDDYPQRGRTKQVSGTFLFGQDVTTSTSTRDAGYVFKSSDETRMFQAKIDGFTFNQLRDYPGWELFLTEAKRTWEAYRVVAHPAGYKRIALRFINRIDLPAAGVDMSNYFRTTPEVSKDLPQHLDGFFYQVQLPLKEIESTVTITETAIAGPSPDKPSVLLDIDLFRTASLSGSQLWQLFETLRDWKNRVFEACITDATRELFR